MTSIPGSLSFAKLEDARSRLLIDQLSHTISTPICIRSAFFQHQCNYEKKEPVTMCESAGVNLGNLGFFGQQLVAKRDREILKKKILLAAQ